PDLAINLPLRSQTFFVSPRCGATTDIVFAMPTALPLRSQTFFVSPRCGATTDIVFAMPTAFKSQISNFKHPLFFRTSSPFFV
ncbi:MAG: hypothetical protein IKG75_06675, partial [Bacteroidaceae bacterium]|nr:hypothetical protein [Bacteroidaceae bacterium]